VFDPNSFNRKLSALNLNPVRGKVNVEDLKPVNVRRVDTPAAQDWCEDKFKDNWIWSAPTYTDQTTFYFKTSQDALLFKLAFNTT